MNPKTPNRQEDRLSTLPDNLIEKILSYLPTVDVVRTTVLSKSWNNLWASYPSLDFDDDRDDPRRRLDFIQFVYRVLLFRQRFDIEKFKLKLEHLDEQHCFEDWIATAATRNVKELHLAFARGASHFKIPCSVFACKSLTALRLEVHGSPIPDECPFPWSFRELKFLHVTIDRPNYDLTEKLFARCPVVEDVIIDGRTGNMKFDFIVGAPKLKTLTVCLDDPEHYDENIFLIDAPELEKLELKSVSLSTYNLDSAKSLVSAIISFNDISASEAPSFPTCVTVLLAGISHVRYLSLSAHSFEVSYLPAAFVNLKKLDVLLHKSKYWELLVELLNRAPILEDVFLEDKTKCDNEYAELAWNPPEAVAVCLLSQLKTVTIKGFKGHRVEMEVAKYLLSNGHVLNKLTLHTGILYTEVEEMYKEFLKFHRAADCEVKFIKMGYF